MQESSHQLSLKIMHRCPSCSAGIPFNEIRILSESDTTIIAHAHCVQCQANYLTHITHGAQGIIGNSIPTDANYNEAKRFLSESPLGEDDFLEIYKTVKKPNFIKILHN